MKNTQLRRGNKVLHNGIEKTIDCISPGYVILLEDRKGTDDFGQWVNLDEVEFIPLTEEWLLKFGFSFKEDDLGFYFKWELKDDKKEFGFYVPGDEHPHRYKYYCGGWNGEIKYVHQLQNLYFALTGTELELKVNALQ